MMTTFSFWTELSFKAKWTRLYRFYTASAVCVEQICTQSSLFIIRKYIWWYIWCSCSFWLWWEDYHTNKGWAWLSFSSLSASLRTHCVSPQGRRAFSSCFSSWQWAYCVAATSRLLSSHLVWFSNTFTFQKQSLSKWHQWLYCRKRPLKAQPLLPTIIERDEKETKGRK